MRLIALMLASAAVLAACQPTAATKTDAPAVEAPAASADVHPFRIGQLQAWSLRDGSMAMSVSGSDVPWADKAAVTATLTAAGQPGDVVDLSIQPLLVRDGDRLVLIDTGAGGQMGTQGLLMASLRAAGVTPDQITDILISHAHGDHVGGLVDAQGRLVFPNATVRMSAPEWAYMQAGAASIGGAAILAAVTPRVETFEPGAQVTPSILSVPLAGHTPGHSGYEIASGEERLLYFGDALHSSILSVQHPEWVSAWDSDAAAGAATRAALMARTADQSLIVYGNHFPFPGVGRFARQGDGFVWTPEPEGAQ